MSQMRRRPLKRFAPLDPNLGRRSGGLPRLKGVVFDVDGTLWYVFDDIAQVDLHVFSGKHFGCSF